MSSQRLAKALVIARDLGVQLQCRFNPKDYTVAKSANWRRTAVPGAASAPIAEFVGTNARILQMTLFLDGWETGSEDVSQDVETLMAWTNPTRQSLEDHRPMPPIVFFHWGNKPLFDAYVKAVSAHYVLFTGDGIPIRASVDVSFEEVPSEPARQNPTSGGPGARSRVVAAGETLHAIAYQEYGRAALWRALADANDIDDALEVTPGTTLHIPPAPRAMELS